MCMSVSDVLKAAGTTYDEVGRYHGYMKVYDRVDKLIWGPEKLTLEQAKARVAAELRTEIAAQRAELEKVRADLAAQRAAYLGEEEETWEFNPVPVEAPQEAPVDSPEKELEPV